MIVTAVDKENKSECSRIRQVKTPVQARSAESVNRMIEAAAGLVAEGGLTALTIAAVAKRSGRSNGAIYHRFTDREELVSATLDWFLSRIEATMTAGVARCATSADPLAALVDLYDQVFSEHRRSFRACMVEARDVPALAERGSRCAHTSERAVVAMLRSRFDCTEDNAVAGAHLLFSVSLARALFDDEEVVSGRLDEHARRRAVANALRSLVGTDDS